MKRIVLFGFAFLICTGFLRSQNVFDPNDPIIRYDQSQPLGSEEHPDPSIPGLQKWVSTASIGISTGTDTFNASSFKQYFINFNGAPMAFRIKFPYSYLNPDSANKKYPINLFLHGGGEVGCSTNGGIYNNEKQLWLGGEMYRDFVNKNQFDGFLLYPQYVVSDGCFAGWGTAPAANFQAILAMVDSMVKYIRADNDRLLVDGLSGGGYGAWKMVDNYPQRVAKIMPSASAGSVSNRTKFVHIPIWFATGGKDVDPSPAQAQNVLTKMKEIGADIRYTLFPERGHSVWYQHWREPDFVGAMNDVHKANPLVFFQRSEFCKEEDVNAKLGITPGFYAYEWQRDGVTIATSTNGVKVIVDPAPVITYTGNEITIKLYGTYRVRFKRTVTSEWSDWSRKPALITTKGTTQTSPITVKGKKSRVLPSPDGSATVPLTLADGFINYQWYRVSDDSLVATTQDFNAPVGEYKARYEEQYGCGNSFSPVFSVVDANGSPKPDAVTKLTAVPQTQSSILLNWTQGAGENGFEVFRSNSTGGPYQFITILATNAKTYTDTGLVKNTLYFYKIRAVSETGAALPSNESTAKTLIDNSPPTAPYGLTYLVSSATSVHLGWQGSTDNEQVARYDVYVNGKKLYTALDKEFNVAHLDSLIPYTFIVRAVDAAGNISAPSNQVTYTPAGAVAGPKPGVPSSVAAVSLAYNKIQINWADTISNETGFEIVRSTTVSGTYVPVTTVNANGTTFIDSGLNSSTKYYYKVRAINNNGESAFSVKVNATTQVMPETPDSPPQLSGEAASNGSVSLTWTDDSGNETGYKIFKSSDGETFTQAAALPANSNAYTDEDVASFATYFYYVVGTNSAGLGPKSNVLQIRAGNNPPVLHGLQNIFVKAGSTVTSSFSVTDDAGDVVTVSIGDKPSFITLTNSGNGNYSINASPASENTGTYSLPVIAKDNNNKADTVSITVLVGDQMTRSVYVNFGSSGKFAQAPWNNWLGTRADGNTIANLKDESNVATGFSVTTVNAWTGTTNLGHITGNNSGVFPDAVLGSGLADSGQAKQIKISGLNPSMQYNLVFAGSLNEGITAQAEYATGSLLTARTSTLNARYNTNQTANLNSLVPDANGEILVTITKTGSSPYTYLNGLVIEEYNTSIQLLNPNNIYAEAADRKNVKLTWSDRTNNEMSAGGYELVRATDSLFTKNVTTINLPANSNQYTNTGLSPDTKYWYRVRAKSLSGSSGYSKRISVTTPAAIVYVNFNVTVEDAAAPWNNLTTPPLSNFTTSLLKDQAGVTTTMALTLTQEFNGEFTAGVNTGNNSGVVPDDVLMANYWLDNGQISQFKLSGLNHGKRYRFGFIGSSSPPNWFKGNYTATYNVDDKTVYLNSWQNSTKVVYIDDIAPDPDGKVLLNFSTTQEAAYGFNSGLIIQEYTYTAPVQNTDTIPTTPVDTIPSVPADTIPTIPVDTIPTIPVDTIPTVPVDTIPTIPVDSIPNIPPVDTIPTIPVDTIPTIPVDTIPTVPVDTIPTIPVDTIPTIPVDTIPTVPVDTIPGTPVTPVDSIPPAGSFKAFPNPFRNIIHLSFYNARESDKISVEIYDPYGRLTFRQNLGTRPAGNNTLDINGFTAEMRVGIYIAALKINGKISQSVKIIKVQY
jgi:fibronectin type 3 domain-containing protein